MNENNGYGGLAGFSGPALGGSGPVEVVRFQDLHRRHAPASAGLPQFGGVAEAQPDFGDVLATPPDFGNGGMPSYGAAPTSVTFKDNSFEYTVGTRAPYVVTIIKAPPGNARGVVDPAQKSAPYQAILRLALQKFPSEFEQARQEDGAAYVAERSPAAEALAPTVSYVAPPKTTPTTEREKAEQNDWTKSSAAQKGKDLVSGILEGYKSVRGREADIAKQQASGDVKTGEESKALTYALWAGGALLGIGAIVLIVKAVSDDDDKKKGE